MFTGRDQCLPPSKDLIIWIWPAAEVVALKPNWKLNTYTTPRESVRTVQPVRPNPFLLDVLFVADVSWCCDQWSPPSVEVSAISGWFVKPLPLPRKAA